jgi:co-chaperonin GroES (HSP10)
MEKLVWKKGDRGYDRPSDALLAGALRIRVKPGYVVIRRAPTPTHAGSGLIEIPEKYRDEPMEGVVVAVGPGYPFEEHYCRGLKDDGVYEDCGHVATVRLVPLDGAEREILDAPRVFVCPSCLDKAAQEMLRGHRRPCEMRPLLKSRPTEVQPGDRVVFSKWAGAKQTVDVMGEPLIMTDDVLAFVDEAASLVIRHEAV